MFRSNNKQKVPAPTWFFSRIRIYDDYITMGFGGSDEQGIPVIENILRQITPKFQLASPYTYYSEGSHFVVKDLSGFTRQIGWLMIGVLVGQGWFIQEFREEGREANLSANIELIDLLRNN